MIKGRIAFAPLPIDVGPTTKQEFHRLHLSGARGVAEGGPTVPVGVVYRLALVDELGYLRQIALLRRLENR